MPILTKIKCFSSWLNLFRHWVFVNYVGEYLLNALVPSNMLQINLTFTLTLFFAKRFWSSWCSRQWYFCCSFSQINLLKSILSNLLGLFSQVVLSSDEIIFFLVSFFMSTVEIDLIFWHWILGCLFSHFRPFAISNDLFLGDQGKFFVSWCYWNTRKRSFQKKSWIS